MPPSLTPGQFRKSFRFPLPMLFLKLPKRGSDSRWLNNNERGRYTQPSGRKSGDSILLAPERNHTAPHSEPINNREYLCTVGTSQFLVSQVTINLSYRNLCFWYFKALLVLT